MFPTLQRIGMTFPEAAYTPRLRAAGYCLGEIPDFGGLLPKAHTAGVPVFELTDEEIGETGPVLQGMRTKRDQLKQSFQEVAEDLTTLLNHA